MKRKRILRSTPAYPVRSRRYYADLEQLDYEAAVRRVQKREAAQAESARDTGADTTSTNTDEKE